MPLNGSGDYTPPSPAFPAVPGEIIYADNFNTIILDMSEALSEALYADGQRLWAGDQYLNNIVLLNGRATTQASIDDSDKIATTAFVNNVAFNLSLPGQSGNAGKVLTSNGTDAFWGASTGANIFTHLNLGGF